MIPSAVQTNTNDFSVLLKLDEVLSKQQQILAELGSPGKLLEEITKIRKEQQELRQLVEDVGQKRFFTPGLSQTRAVSQPGAHAVAMCKSRSLRTSASHLHDQDALQDVTKMVCASTTKQVGSHVDSPQALRLTEASSDGRSDGFRSNTSISNGVPLYLPADWPVVSRRMPQNSRTPTSSRRTQHTLRQTLFPKSQLLSGALVEDSKSGFWDACDMYVSEPDSTKRVIFDVCSIIVLLADLTLMPTVMAFDLSTSVAIEAFLWFAACFWTFDVLVSFNTGYYVKGQLEMRRHVIALSYLRGWFILDFGIVCCDWTMLVFLSEGTRTLKLMRFVKLGRAPLRMLRLVRLFEDLLDRYFSAGMAACMRILAMFLVSLWLTHLLCCGWYALAVYPDSDTGRTWLNSLRGADTADFLYLYSTSLHWSMAQLTLGAVEIVATNSVERCCSVFLLLLGLLFNSSLVSALSATFIHLQMMTSDQMQEQMTLTRFLRQHQVSMKLKSEVQRMVKLRIDRHDMLLEENVSSLTLLPVSLITRLRCEIYKPHLLTHQFFNLIASLSPDIVPDLTQTVRVVHLVEGDHLFLPGEEAVSVFFLSQGLMCYIQEPFTSPGVVGKDEKESVVSGSWFCEAALWTHWTHVGRVEAASACQITLVGVEGAISALHKERLSMDISVSYGTQFHKCVCKAKPPFSSFPTDLTVPFGDFGDIIQQMEVDRELRATIMMHVLKRSRTMNANALQTLYDDLLNRKSDLSFNSDGEAHRMVHLLALHLLREDGCVFAQIGKVGEFNGKISPECNLPATRHNSLENLADVCDRLLSTKLSPLKRCVKVVSSTQEPFEAPSKRFHVSTEYQKTVCHCQLQCPIEVPTCVFRDRERAGVSPRTSTHGQRQQIVPDISERQVYAFSHEDQTTVYTWLAVDEFDRLRNADMDTFLQNWISGLEPDPCAVASLTREVEMETAQVKELGVEAENTSESSEGWHVAAVTLNGLDCELSDVQLAYQDVQETSEDGLLDSERNLAARTASGLETVGARNSSMMEGERPLQRDGCPWFGC